MNEMNETERVIINSDNNNWSVCVFKCSLPYTKKQIPFYQKYREKKELSVIDIHYMYENHIAGTQTNQNTLSALKAKNTQWRKDINICLAKFFNSVFFAPFATSYYFVYLLF